MDFRSFSIRPSSLWWLWVPVAALAVQFVIELTVPEEIYPRLLSENGPHELIQFFLLLFALIVAARILLMPQTRRAPWLLGWAALAAAGCLYVGGEEVSWGQHFLNWTTPEYWRAVNDQQETNLHNVSSWLDQKPRLLLEIGVIFGGLILPLFLKMRPGWLPPRLVFLTPPSWLAVTAGLFLFVKLADKAGEMTGYVLFGRASEVGELYIFYFVLLYLIDLRRRIAASALQGDGPP